MLRREIQYAAHEKSFKGQLKALEMYHDYDESYEEQVPTTVIMTAFRQIPTVLSPR